MAATLPERIRACAARHPDWPARRISNSIKGSTEALVRECLPASKPAPEAPKGRTLAAFRAEYDVREKIRAGLRGLGKGVYMTDPEFRDACEVPAQYWRRFADLDEFKPYRWRFRETLYWGQPATLAEMREIVGVV